MALAIAYITHNECLRHEMSAHHPESPQRLYAIDDQIAANRLAPLLHHYDAPLATLEQLSRVHKPSYINHLAHITPDYGFITLDADTAMNAYTLNAAYRAAGAVVLATQLVCEGKEKRAFCAVRPPGHHAEPSRAMGFCFFNNVAVGIAHALANYGLRRIAIADFDVHHGNGTETMFAAEPRVMLCSVFQHPLYPYSGADSASDHVINVPLPAGTDGKAFQQAITTHWLPALEAFKPELLYISAGFDGHRDDTIANFRLLVDDYQWISEQLVAIADRHADGRIISVLEGGYEPYSLARSCAAHLRVLCGV